MIGMLVVDAWTIDRLTKKDSLNIKYYVDLMEKDMIQAASNYKIGSDISAKLNAISVSKIGGTSTSVSSLSLPERCFGMHTKLILGKVKQARCIWCSRVYHRESKTTMKYQERNRGFYRNQDMDCWYHHIALGGAPKAPPKGALKRRINEMSSGFL